MESKVSLKVQFLFDPNTTWSRLSEFESDLADFLAAFGKQAVKLKTLGTPDGEIIIEVTTMDKLDKAKDDKNTETTVKSGGK